MVRGRNLYDHSYEEDCLTTDQIADPRHPLGEISAANWPSVMQSLRLHDFDYVRGTMTIAYSFTVNAEGGTLCEAFEESAEHQVLNHNLKMVIVYGRHRLEALMALYDEVQLQLTREHIRFCHQYHCDDCLISTAEAIKRTKVADTTTAIIWRNASFLDLLGRMVSYWHAFEPEYNVSFPDTRTNDIIADMDSSNFLT